MKNWGNWSHGELVDVIEETKRKGQKTVSIDQEHTDHYNDKMVEDWLTSMGYKYNSRIESTTIYLEE